MARRLAVEAMITSISTLLPLYGQYFSVTLNIQFNLILPNIADVKYSSIAARLPGCQDLHITKITLQPNTLNTLQIVGGDSSHHTTPHYS